MARKSAAECISSFSSQTGITISSTSTLYSYLVELYNEASIQFNGNGNNIPALKKESNFPNIYNFYGDDGNEDAAFHSMIGWMFACQVAELKPTSRTNIFKIGYEFGGYKTSDGTKIYGYKFNYDPIVNRIVGGFIYAAMRGLKKPNIDAMRSEVGGSKYNKTLKQCYDTNSWDVGTNDFYIDLRQFLPSAPGPYHSSYSNRSSLQKTIGDAVHDSTFKIPEVDYQIYMLAVNNYTLSNSTYKAATIQAIADCDGEMAHVLGADNKGTYDGVTIKAVFGPSVIGETIDPTSYKAKFVERCQKVSSSQRSILQATEEHINPPQYGRERPGCSWRKNETPANSSDNNDGSGRSGGTDNYNVSVNAQIDDWDGNPTGYYDANGNWVYPNDDNYTSASDYKNKKQAELWASSYPSGHSSGITGAGMLLSELHPANADKILKAVNQFAVNRTIVKYHWNSDTLIGRLLGTAGNSISHAASDYENLLNGDYSTISGSSDNPSDPGGNGSGSGSIPLDSERPAMVISPNNDMITVSMASSLAVNGRETDIPWGGIGAAGTIKWKRDIIDVLNYLVKPVRDLRISGLAYNLLTSYSYFHNDICYDLKWLWAYYILLRTNYYLLVEYKENVEDWEANEYNPFVSSFNTFSSDYTAALTALINGGPYYVFDHMSDPEYYSQAEADAYNYQLPGAIHTTDIKSEIVIPDEPDEPTTTYSLSISVNNGSSHIVAGEKDTYESGDVVQIALNSNTGYQLPGLLNIVCSGASIIGYTLSNNNTTGTVTIQISNNASMTITCIEEGQEEPEVPASITFATATEAYSLSPSSSYTITRQTPTIVYPNNDDASNYTIEYSVSDTSIIELNSSQTRIKVNGSGQAWVYATMKKNSDNSTVVGGQYSILIASPQTVEDYKIVVNVKNSVGRLNYDDDDNKIFIESIFIEPISFMVLYNNAQGIAAGQNRNISKDPSNNDIMYNGNDIENITDSSNIYINAGYGRSLQTSNPRSFKCYFQLGHPPVTKTTSNGVTTARIYIEAVDEYPEYSTISYITSDDNFDINDNHNINTDKLNKAFISEKSTSKKSRSNSKSKDIINNDLIFGETITEYYTLEECNEYNSHLPGAKHAGDIKVPSYPIYVEATLPTFPDLPSLPGPMPQISPDFDETLVPIEIFTYTWDKGIPTYNMPYEYVNMTDYIAYTPNVQNVWQTLSYSMLKWKNNQVDDHPALLYEFMDFDD